LLKLFRLGAVTVSWNDNLYMISSESISQPTNRPISEPINQSIKELQQARPAKWHKSRYNVVTIVMVLHNLTLINRDLHVDGNHPESRGTCRISTGIKASVAGFPWRWKQMQWDSRVYGKTFYGIPTGM